MKPHSLKVDMRRRRTANTDQGAEHLAGSSAMPPPVAPLQPVSPMTAFPCPACMLWHFPPKCDHNSEARCTGGCGGPVGYRWTDDRGKPAGDGTRCWTCSRPAARHGLAL